MYQIFLKVQNGMIASFFVIDRTTHNLDTRELIAFKSRPKKTDST